MAETIIISRAVPKVVGVNIEILYSDTIEKRAGTTAEPTATAARFDEAEPVATKANPQSTAKSRRDAGAPKSKPGRAELKRGGAFWTLLLDQRYYFIVFGHGAGADFCAA